MYFGYSIHNSAKQHGSIKFNEKTAELSYLSQRLACWGQVTWCSRVGGYYRVGSLISLQGKDQILPSMCLCLCVCMCVRACTCVNVDCMSRWVLLFCQGQDRMATQSQRQETGRATQQQNWAAICASELWSINCWESTHPLTQAQPIHVYTM